MPAFLWRSVADEAKLAELPEGGALRRRDQRAAGLRPAGRGLGLLGLEGRLLLDRGGRARLLRRDALHAGGADGRAELAAVVQHRAALGLRHRRAGAGAFLRRLPVGRAGEVDRAPTSIRSRTPASSSRSRTTSSTRAGSWTSGPARRGSSSTARAPAPTSPRCAAENERLAGGGKSSGLMSFLKIGDRAAGAIKSGGTTRRAAKMVICDMDHPDIEDFINWKVVEEQKVASARRRLEDPPRAAGGDPRRDPRPGTAPRPTPSTRRPTPA